MDQPNILGPLTDEVRKLSAEIDAMRSKLVVVEQSQVRPEDQVFLREIIGTVRLLCQHTQDKVSTLEEEGRWREYPELAGAFLTCLFYIFLNRVSKFFLAEKGDDIRERILRIDT